VISAPVVFPTVAARFRVWTAAVPKDNSAAGDLQAAKARPVPAVAGEGDSHGDDSIIIRSTRDGGKNYAFKKK